MEALGGADALLSQSSGAGEASRFAVPSPDGAGAALAPPAATAPAAAAPRAAAPSGFTIGRVALVRAGLALAPVRWARNRALEEIDAAQRQILRVVQTARPEEGRCGRLVLVTSARPGEGKTFCALNMAASMASSGAAPVVLVDADWKKDSATGLLGCADLPGLQQLAAEAAGSPASLLVPTQIERLFFLPHGARPRRTAQEPASGAMLAAALLRFGAALPGHVLVVDTPPCLSASDASALAPAAGQVVLVVEAEYTQQGEVEAALKAMAACPTLQLLLNRAKVGATEGSGVHGDHGARSGGH